ncbi:hypothetical protein [Ruania rhizosphaerae]|uniref:hypothetical protein n=1 Tax=Ruania rhizosphaerae TaxID=1840413 RepID=UPI00190F608D|nr:hypothetical protein [Ruania rhizosphaerae]
MSTDDRPPAAGRLDPPTMAEAATRARTAALGTDGVAELHAGKFAEVRTYLPGATVPGVRVEDGVVHVHVVLTPDRDIPATTGLVHTAVAAATGFEVVVHVDDVATTERPLRSTS